MSTVSDFLIGSGVKVWMSNLHIIDNHTFTLLQVRTYCALTWINSLSWCSDTLKQYCVLAPKNITEKLDITKDLFPSSRTLCHSHTESHLTEERGWANISFNTIGFTLVKHNLSVEELETVVCNWILMSCELHMVTSERAWDASSGHESQVITLYIALSRQVYKTILCASHQLCFSSKSAF